ncbi:hypothetical protein AVEN_114103-1 [Araneus ventricosus]|uniref:Endonuclease/exonuclease/phosphatase domain-containing protein n=1 Tax=Araneus ventricosus TaxID=182803 RepID=A0A4Y2NUK8_ARAVE|nr:hypothetical protein AVEN_41268-1 [Araneus ventricosus]GBN42563.1 hypothetical protein AVEN_114103-1 [Araneus ventricosus]
MAVLGLAFNNLAKGLNCSLINLNHAIAATGQMEQDLIKCDIDILCITEPYIVNEHVLGFPTGYLKIYKQGSPWAAIILKTEYKFIPILITNDIVAINLEIDNVNMLLFISIYCSPSEEIDALSELGKILEQFKDEMIVINGDLNAKSPAWIPVEQDKRGKTLLEFIYRLDIDI